MWKDKAKYTWQKSTILKEEVHGHDRQNTKQFVLASSISKVKRSRPRCKFWKSRHNWKWWTYESEQRASKSREKEETKSEKEKTKKWKEKTTIGVKWAIDIAISVIIRTIRHWRPTAAWADLQIRQEHQPVWQRVPNASWRPRASH